MECYFILRFSKENRETRHQYSFLPFGQGPRMCPGQKLAMIEVRCAITSILKSYKISVTNTTEVNQQGLCYKSQDISLIC